MGIHLKNKHQPKLVNIDDLNLLRVFAISLVVLRHCFAPFTGDWEAREYFPYNGFANVIGNYISTISMPLFVFISGLLFAYLRNKLKKYPNYRILAQKKMRRLLRPFVILAPLYVYFFLESDSLKDFIYHIWKGAGHLWFLLMIFTVFMIFYPLETFFKKNSLKGFLLVSLLFILYPLFSRLGLYPVSKAFEYFPYFYVGYFFYFKSAKILSFLENKFWLLFFLHLIIFIISLIVPEYIRSPTMKALFDGFILFPLGIISISFVFLFFSGQKKWNLARFDKPINNVNEMSYYIYLLHQPILKLVFELEFLRNLPAFFVVGLTFLFGFSVSLLLGNIFMGFKVGRRLIGAH